MNENHVDEWNLNLKKRIIQGIVWGYFKCIIAIWYCKRPRWIFIICVS